MDNYEKRVLGNSDASLDPIRSVGRQRMLHEIVQSVIGECPYIGTARDDEVFWQLHAIQEENGLPYDFTADDAYNLYRTNYEGGS